MPRELDVSGVYLPSLLLILLVTLPVFWALDRVLAKNDVYRWIWHIDLCRLALFVILFGTLGLWFYR